MVMLMRRAAVALRVAPAGGGMLNRVCAGGLDAEDGARNDQGAGEHAAEHAEGLAGARRKSTGRSRALGTATEFPQAVSYTHLTLPTIYSV